jgi:hypothetical protein
MAKSKAEVIIISRSRVAEATRSVKAWLEQGHHVTLLVEPEQADAYGKAIPLSVNILSHPKSNQGIGYARMIATNYAYACGLDAFVMADDDTIVTDGDADLLVDFVRRGKAFLCGGWMQIHNAWYGRELGETPGMVIPHFGDKLFAVNTQMAIDAGNWNPKSVARSDCWMLLQSIQHGYLWWIHTGVKVREPAGVGAPGGIASMPMTREEKYRVGQGLMHERWPRYVSRPPRKYHTRMREMIRDFIGVEAAEVYKTKQPFRDDAPDIPHRSEPLKPYPREPDLFSNPEHALDAPA